MADEGMGGGEPTPDEAAPDPTEAEVEGYAIQQPEPEIRSQGPRSEVITVEESTSPDSGGRR